MDLGARLIRLVLISTLSSLAILGCSSGGGGSSPDTEPNAVNLVVQKPTPESDILPGEQQISNTVTISGINREISASITGGAELRINDGPWTTSGTLENGDTIQVRANAPGFGETLTANLSIGDSTTTYTFTTDEQDLTPEDLMAVAQTGVAREAVLTFGPFTIEGINDTVDLSMTGGTFRIGDTDVIDQTSGTAEAGDMVTVQLTASPQFGTEKTAMLSIGTETFTLSATTLARDITPDDFEFTAQTDLERSTPVVSNEVTVEGINDELTPISIVDGEYNINDGDYTAEEGTVQSGDRVTVRATSSTEFGTEVAAVLTVGTFDASFSTNTVARDITPDAFAFMAITGAAQATLFTSEMQTISGINDELTPISITGGQYQINDGALTAEAGTVKTGDTVIVQTESSANFSGVSTAALTVGETTENFVVTSVARDVTPEDFNFTAQTGVERSTGIFSNTVTITGINDDADVSISEGGSYRIADTSGFNTLPSFVSNGETITVLVTSSADFETETSVTLTVGEVQKVFSVTTLDRDITPDGFAFVAQTEIDPETRVESNAVTISGMNDAAPISISGGDYSLNGGAFTASAGTVSNGDSLVLGVVTGTEESEVSTVTISIGEGDMITMESFTATVKEDLTPPTATIMFPPPVSMTDVATVYIRGTAEDNKELTGVTVNGETAISDDNFATWNAVVTLAAGDNTIEVVATDAEGLESEVQSVFVEQVADIATERFPKDPESEDMGFFANNNFQTSELGFVDGRPVVFFSTSNRGLWTLDLQTGVRKLFTDNASFGVTDMDDLGFRVINGIQYSDEGKVYVSSRAKSAVHEIDLATKARTLIDVPDPDMFFTFAGIFNLILTENNLGEGELYLFKIGGIVRHNLVSGEQAIVSADNIPEGNTIYESAPADDIILFQDDTYLFSNRDDNTVDSWNIQTQMTDVVITGFEDQVTGVFKISDTELLISDQGDRDSFLPITKLGIVYSYDVSNIETPIQSVFSGDMQAHSSNTEFYPGELTQPEGAGYVLAQNSDGMNAFWAIDLETGARVIFSKSLVANL